jgi:hypothetical protein
MKRIFIHLFFLMTIALIGGCASSGGNNAFLDTHDHDDDDRLSRDEYHRSFDSLDTDRDGHLDQTELHEGHLGGARR